ncbi:MAG: flagellar protein FlaG [Pseudomonadaceae bacterium]|jgi:flagellar protein FlaG|nr:flagellar protein FlaG [Pseudomonadaceae bacterium]
MDVGSTKKSAALDVVSTFRQPSALDKPEVRVAEEVSVPPVKEAARAQVEDAVVTLQAFAQSVSRDLNFSVDDGSGQVVVKVTDATSGDVIRQIPSEEALQLAENLSDARSLLFKAEA